MRSSFLPLLSVPFGVASIALITSCTTEPTERPPAWVSGMAAGGGSPVGGVGIRTGTGAGGANTDPETEAELGALSGQVVAYLDDSFFLTDTWTKPADVFVEPSTGSTFETAPYDGASYSFADALSGTSVWMGVRAAEGSDTYPTLSRVSTEDGTADVRLVPASVISSVFATLAVPELPNEGAGHVVLRFVDPDGKLVSGVTVEAPQSSFVTYSSAGSWTEFQDRTTASGLAFIGNILASKFPGGTTDVTLGGAWVGELEVLVAAGTVTTLTLVVP